MIFLRNVHVPKDRDIDMSSHSISFEFFPPKTEIGMTSLLEATKTLASTDPAFFSVTSGARGSAQTHTPNTVYTIHQHTHIQTAPHISCFGAEKSTIKQLLNDYIQQGISRLVVLRGDTPIDASTQFQQFCYASELVQFIRQETGDHFHIEVACYPEFHPQTTDLKRALFHFKEKIDAGASGAITQYFYNPDAYFRFLDSCQKMGIYIPITPGIMPITNYEKLVSFSIACGAEIPRWLNFRLLSYQDNIAAIQAFGEEVVSDLCKKLLDGGAPGLHFYTLNKAEPSMDILRHLKLVQHGITEVEREGR